jgi:hypothetical protein
LVARAFLRAANACGGGLLSALRKRHAAQAHDLAAGLPAETIRPPIDSSLLDDFRRQAGG